MSVYEKVKSRPIPSPLVAEYSPMGIVGPTPSEKNNPLASPSDSPCPLTMVVRKTRDKNISFKPD